MNNERDYFLYLHIEQVDIMLVAINIHHHHHILRKIG
jgi:hypothetical protein